VKKMLANYLNKIVEIHYGGTATIRGKLLDIVDEVVKLEDEDKVKVYVAIDKIHAFREVTEKEKPVGFISKSKAKD